MSLSYDSLTALINERYIPTLYDNIFNKNNYLARKLKDKAKTFNGRQFTTPLEYANGSNAAFTAKYGTVTLTPIDPFTAATWEPKMITDSLVISLEEELMMNTPEAVTNIVTAKMKNVMKGLELFFSLNLWSRSLATNGWNPLYTLLDASTTQGGIAVADMATWATTVIDAAGTDYTDDPSLEADLVDPAKDVYILKLLQRGIAVCRHQTGENPDLIVVPQYIWDLLEFILQAQKGGSPLSARAASLGFTALDYRGIDITPDDTGVIKQTGDTDGLMWFLNTNYLYMFFNSGAKFKAQEWVKAANQNAKSCLINVYGNLITTNRQAHCLIKNVRSPQSYAG